MPIDFVMLAVAMVLLVLAMWVAARTQSRPIRFTLVTIVVVIVALMLWNLATHGGLHAV